MSAPWEGAAVVVVNYGVCGLVRDNLAPLVADAPGLRVVVVDNLHSPAERDAVRALSAGNGWDLVEMAGNDGFGAGVNAGIGRARELGCDAYVVLNPDATISAADLGALVEQVRAQPSMLVSPRVVRTDGRVWFDGSQLDLRSGRTGRDLSGPADDVVPWLSGACLAVHESLWSRLGGFTGDYFLYWEDVDLSFRCLASGGSVLVRQDLTATHEVGATQGRAQRRKSDRYYRYNCRNRLLFAARNLPPRTALRWLASAPGYAVEVVLRGGRRQLLPFGGPAWAALGGTLSGLREVASAVLASRLPRRPRYREVRLYRTVRSAHLERARSFEPATIVYESRRYDFDPSLADGLDLVRAGTLAAAFLALRNPVDLIEVNEPLMLSSRRRSLAVLAAIRVAGAVRRRRVTVVTYAIENKEPRWGGGAGAVLRRRSARAVAASVDRIAFGTEASRDLYAALLPGMRASSALVPALPAPCPCPADAPREPDLVLFLGALEQRKGFPNLLDAWPLLAQQDSRARLLVVGKGSLAPQARDLAAADDRVEFVEDPPRRLVHEALRRAGVLVLLSQPSATWREQVGLPLVEGLAHGCTVVTTTQTGLATWLAAHGHTVVPDDAGAPVIAAALAAALQARRPAGDVLADLPAEDGRLGADRWLRHGGVPPVAPADRPVAPSLPRPTARARRR